MCVSLVVSTKRCCCCCCKATLLVQHAQLSHCASTITHTQRHKRQFERTFLQRCTFDSNVRRIVCNRAVSRCASVPKRATPQPSLCTDIRAHTYIANRIFLYGRDRNINEHCNNMLFIHDNNTAMAGRQKNSPQRIRVRVLYEERSFICCTLDLELEL